MIKNSSFDFTYDYLRFDTSWLFEWDVNNITDETIRFYPFTETGTNRTWQFRGVAGADGKTTGVIKHNEYIWNTLEPWLEYDADNIDVWDTSHPDNVTRYLNPGSSYITLSNTIEAVIIDNIPPEFVSDKGTEYVWICDKNSRSDVKRHCEFVFRDQAGLDYKQFEISVNGKTLYKYHRNEDKETSLELTSYFRVLKDVIDDGVLYKTGDTRVIDINDFTTAGQTATEADIAAYNAKCNALRADSATYKELATLNCVDNLKIMSDGYHTYKVQFDLLYGQTNEEIDELNEHGLMIKIWDKAANCSVYRFGEGYKGKKWILIDNVDDISALQPLVIKFYDHDPYNMIVDESTYGSVWCSIYNPNEEFYKAGIEIMAGLVGNTNEAQESSGNIHDFYDSADIDMSTYDSSEYEKTGIIRFKIINIKKAGYVDVNAWLETGVKTFDGMIKNATYAEEQCGPWIIMDADGRKYNIQRYVPKYLRNTEYFEFIKFFELYLNTLYTNLTKGTNISILEKIAKIGDFNDIDRIEHAMLWHYAKQFGMEFNIDLQSMLDLNLGMHNDGILNNRTEDDVIDILKYALKNLPMYNQLKGSEKGMIFAMKMFSLSCKVINLWCKMGPEVEEYPDFVEEDRMFDFTSHFLTSRFNLEFNSLNIDFPTFNENLEVFIRFIKSIKPIVRILNLIKYTIIFEHKYYWLMNPYVHDDFKKGETDYYTYELQWNNPEIEEMIGRSSVDWKVMHANRIWINFVPASINIKYSDSADASGVTPANMINGYTLLASMLNESRNKFIFKTTANYHIKYNVMIKDDKTGTWQIKYQRDDKPSMEFVKKVNLSDTKFDVCDSGFFIYPITGETATYLAEFVKPAYFLNDYIQTKTADEKTALKNDGYTGEFYIEITNRTQNDFCDMKMVCSIDHIPGTEIFHCHTQE